MCSSTIFIEDLCRARNRPLVGAEEVNRMIRQWMARARELYQTGGLPGAEEEAATTALPSVLRAHAGEERAAFQGTPHRSTAPTANNCRLPADRPAAIRRQVVRRPDLPRREDDPEGPSTAAH